MKEMEELIESFSSFEKKLLLLAVYEISCLQRQPQLFADPSGDIDYKACENCPLDTNTDFCKLGSLREEIKVEQERVPLLFKFLVTGED